ILNTGLGETRSHWFCHGCDSDNLYDENGDILNLVFPNAEPPRLLKASPLLSHIDMLNSPGLSAF
ncbi:hypothetical protein CU097_003400, partial [Rhizopus azygosporus]